MHRSSIAYHVSELPSYYRKDLYTLEPSEAQDNYFDGYLFGLDVVFFTTTLRHGRIPKDSVYPTGGDTGQYYKRYQVDLDELFDRECIAYVQQPVDNQVHILIVPLTDVELLEHWENLAEQGRVGRLDMSDNPWLIHAQNGQWYVNDYEEDGFFVNIAFPGPVNVRRCGSAIHRG